MVRFVALVLISALASPALGQSLGALAKKEKERRKKIKEEGVKVRVLSDSDIQRSSPPTAQPTPAEELPPHGFPEVSASEDVGTPATASAPKKIAPPFTLEDRNGRKVSLSDFHGRPVLLDFWATWCGPCRVTMPEVERFHRKYRGKGLQVVGVNIEGKSKKVLQYLDKNGYSFQVLFDKGDWGAEVVKKYQITSIPRTFLIGPDGNVIYKGHPNGLTESLVETALHE